MARSDDIVVAGEARKRGDAELRSLLATKTEELQKAKFKHALGQLRETNKLGALKRDVARLHTVLHERVQAQAEESKA